MTNNDTDTGVAANARWIVVIAFLVAYIFSFVDRMIIGLMVEPLKHDLQLTDTQVSLLQGFAFALFYTVVGLPIGRLVDRRKRVAIAGWGIALWSLFTAACGLAQNYGQLFLARMGVGIGEATLSPSAYSIFADLFDRNRLGVALGVYNVGSAIGGGLAMIVGGSIAHFAATQGSVSVPWLGELHPWQLTFLYVGLPGLLVAAWVLSLPEPRRRDAPVDAVSGEFRAFVKEKRRFVAGHHLGVAFSNLAAFAVVSWMPVMLMRAYGWTIAEAGLAVGGALIVGGLLGLIGSGWLSDRSRVRHGVHGRLRFCIWISLLGIPASAALGSASSGHIALLLFTGIYVCSIGTISPAAATLQEIAPPRLRGQSSAFYLFVVNLIGIPLGATSVALLSDHVFTATDGIRHSLSVVAPAALAIAALCYRASIGGIDDTTSR